MERAYSRTRILVALGIILVLILVDHLNSPTFAFQFGPRQCANRAFPEG